MYRLATLLALLIALLAGCGGGSDDDGVDASPPPAAAAKTPAAAQDDAAKPTRKSPRAAKEKKKDEVESSGDSEEKDEHGHDTPKGREAVQAASAKELASLIRVAVVSSLEIYNLKLADLDIADQGRRVGVSITRASACNAVAKEEFAMAERIRSATVQKVKTVRFTVAGTGKELGDYVLSCKREPIPNGPGVTVFDQTGVGGPVTTKPFTIKGERWAIEWENTANTLAVIVLPLDKDNKNSYAPIGSQKKETGRKTYRHAGRYKLKLYGSALWTVRVKDIR